MQEWLNEQIPAFRNFFNLISRDHVKERFKCPFENVEIKSEILKSHRDAGMVKYIIESSNLKLNIPSCMISTESIIINTSIKSCRVFYKFHLLLKTSNGMSLFYSRSRRPSFG